MKSVLFVLLGLISASVAKADVYNCYQDQYAKNASFLNATIRTGGGVISLSLSTLTPGSTYSAQMHILNDLESSVHHKAKDVKVIYSEGKHLEFPGFINEVKGDYEITIKSIAKNKLNLSVKQNIDQWQSEWKTDCLIVPGTSH